ncbi:MAG TPA: right-handed parallel beta-helix repeat-containing protein, partial [bacterium]|nr:right-handed parallel beta-helix repeat-containing protein [bacterium]
MLVWPGNSQGTLGYSCRIDMKSGVVLMAVDDGTGRPVVVRGSAAGVPAFNLTGCSEVTEIVGFEITWDSGQFGSGGGVAAYVSSGTLRRNVFRDCSAGVGSAVYLFSSSMHLVDNLFVDNDASGGGGLIAVSGEHPVIENNTFVRTNAPAGTDGAVLYGVGTDVEFRKNVIDDAGGDSAVLCSGGGSATLECNLFGTLAGLAFGGTCAGSLGSGGNFQADPMFCGPDDFGVCADSPALTGPCGALG